MQGDEHTTDSSCPPPTCSSFSAVEASRGKLRTLGGLPTCSLVNDDVIGSQDMVRRGPRSTEFHRVPQDWPSS